MILESYHPDQNAGPIEATPLRELIHHRCSVDHDASLSVVFDQFQAKTCDYFAVVNGGLPIGIISKAKVGSILGSRFGYPLFGKTPIRDHVLEKCLVLKESDALRQVLPLVLKRAGNDFYNDAILVGNDGHFLGMLSVLTLANMQSQLVDEKVHILENQEQLLKNRNTELMALTTELNRANENLEKARDAALETARLKSEFLANMSHEIRTPMNGIIGMTSFLLETELNTDQREYTEIVKNSADGLLTIINDILDFSKIESGKLSIEELDFQIEESVEGVLEILGKAAAGKNIEVAAYIDPQIPAWLRGDPGRIRQILTNLVGNAVKFTEQGEVLVSVSSVKSPEGRHSVRFEVHDTGIGIAKSAQGMIFQAFTQADGSTTRKYGGTGLGLAISKQLVELMHGEIGFESIVGKGSNFWFTIPFAKSHQLVLQDNPDEPDALKGIRVLVVDDNATNRRILEKQTVSWGMDCTSVDNAASALQVMDKNHSRGVAIDLVLLDMQMPDVDGLSLARDIKADPRFLKTPLVMMTSIGQRMDQEEIESAGLSAYLVKPVKQSRLLQCLRSLFRGQLNPKPKVFRPAHAENFGQNTGSFSILLVEDNSVNQRVALLQLRKLGLEAKVATDGIEALDRLRSESFDLVLMDCQMPHMDGYEATSRIRLDPDLQHLYIIAMTANALEGDREKCIAAGMNDYVTKPIKPDLLKTAIDKFRMEATLDLLLEVAS